MREIICATDSILLGLEKRESFKNYCFIGKTQFRKK
jgi:hypothetical protein